jgi:putative CocE/NonD family hydrolase
LPFDHETTDGYQFFLNLGPLGNANAKYFKDDVPFWSEVMRHGTYDDFWKARDVRPHLKNIRPAVMTVGGWFDAEDLFGALETYKSVEAHSPGAYNILVMGPWVHGGWHRGEGQSLGPIPFNSKTGDFFRENIELPFFEYHLKGKGELKHPEAWVFQMGMNQWRSFDAWPPRENRPKSFFLREGGRLATEPSGETRPEAACDEYVSDPVRPVPFSNKIAIGMSPEYMIEDQRFVARRPDVLVYQTDVLEEDFTIAGPIQVELQVSTSGTDSDWILKVIDVYPDDYPDPSPNPTGVRMGGYQQLVRGEVMRGKFRNSFEKPEPFVPNQPTAVKFTLPDVCHTFRSGHRLMVQVHSTWFPLVDRNPQTFLDIYTAKPSDFQKATERVYRSRDLASRVNVLVLP